MKILWSPRALDRVREAAAEIARDRPGAARRWAESVFEAAATLAQHPSRGRVVPEIGRADIRELLHGPYRLIYQVVPGTIHVLTIRHGRRLLDPDELG